MAKVINHDLRSDNSGTIWLPPNPDYPTMATPELHLASTTKTRDLGTKYTFNDKVYKYCRTNTGGVLYCHVGGANLNKIAIARALVAADAAALATAVTVADASCAKDAYKYGHVYIAASGSVDAQNRGIIGNTVSDGTNTILTLDFPLERSIAAAADYATVYSSIYSKVAKSDGNEYYAVVCLPCLQIATTALEYFWGQTWGIAYVGVGASGYGGEAGERTMCFDGNGYIQELYDMIALSKSHQIAGFQVVNTSTPEDVNCIMLQISP